jgi:ankyrin repeat protein
LEVSCPTDGGSDSETTRPRVIKEYALIKYAARHWFEHLRISEQEKSHVKIGARRLEWFVQEESPRRREFWRQVLWRCNHTGFVYTTPIYFAMYAQLESVVDILLPRFLDVDQHLDYGMTCLTLAARHNNIRVATKLLESGADVNKATTGREGTPLHVAAENADEEMVDLLLSYNADINARSPWYGTPFYSAARGGSIHILRRLYTLGSDVNGKDIDGWTPLMAAVDMEHWEAVTLLLELGAD